MGADLFWPRKMFVVGKIKEPQCGGWVWSVNSLPVFFWAKTNPAILGPCPRPVKAYPCGREAALTGLGHGRGYHKTDAPRTGGPA